LDCCEWCDCISGVGGIVFIGVAWYCVGGCVVIIVVVIDGAHGGRWHRCALKRPLDVAEVEVIGDVGLPSKNLV
jgi:hypothetical protein